MKKTRHGANLSRSDFLPPVVAGSERVAQTGSTCTGVVGPQCGLPQGKRR